MSTATIRLADATVVGVPYVSATRLSSLQACERRFAYRYVDGEREPGSEATAMGQAHAEGLEETDVAAAKARASNHYDLERPALEWGTQESYDRDGAMGHAILDCSLGGYFDRGWNEDVEREHTYVVAIPGLPGFALQTRVDGIHPDGHLVEDKLRSGTALAPDKVQNEVLQSFQLTAEIWTHWKATGDLIPVHFRTIKKPDPRRARAAYDKGELEPFMAEHFAKEGIFSEYVVERTPDQLGEFESELIVLAGRAFDITERGAATVRDTSACFSWGRACPFLARCQS